MKTPIMQMLDQVKAVRDSGTNPTKVLMSTDTAAAVITQGKELAQFFGARWPDLQPHDLKEVMGMRVVLTEGSNVLKVE